MDWFSVFVAARFKAFFGALAVGVTPVAIKAFEANFFDIPAAWEAWLVAAVGGIVVNFAVNVPAPPKA
jgi:hypothetical protein